MNDINNLTKKHDPLSRKFLTNIEIAKEFIAAHLPAEIQDRLEIDTLSIESGSYIENDLKVHCSDICYKLNLKENKGSAYIYTLLEHQSSAEVLMPLRIIKYQLAIIQQHLDKYNKISSKLPVVIPLIFYNGVQSPYPYASDIAELFADTELYNKVQLGKFKVVDLTVMEEDKILRHGKLAVLEMLMKHIRARNFINIIKYIVAALKIGHDQDINKGLVDGALSYLINAREVEEIRQLINKISENIPDYKEDIMTYAEELRREGEQRGEQRGMQIGEQRGMQIGEQKAQNQIAKDLLKSGIDRVIVAQATHLSLEQLDKLN